MPLLVLSGAQAMANVKTNSGSTWPSRGEIGSRLEPFARPNFEPGFRLIAGERIFTVGSCFARNVEIALESYGFQIPTRAIIRSDAQFALIGQNILNNYGVPSILNEVRWALDAAHPFIEEQAFFEVAPGKFVDAHLNHAIRPAPLEVVRARRRAILAAYQAIRDCRVVVMTLGLAECWFDTVTSTYLNTAPRRSLIRLHEHRFELHVLGYDEILADLRTALALMRAHGHPDQRVILTVSPVALGSTFRPDDVMVANAYSKAVLRTVAEAVALGDDRIDYYPSFESVTLSSRDAALEDDLVHPTQEVIQLNTHRMVRAYVGAEALGADDIREVIAENPAAALSLLGEREDLLASDQDLARLLFGAASRLARMDMLKLALAHVGEAIAPDEQRLAHARVAMEDGDAAKALALLAEPPLRRGARNLFWQTRLAAQLEIGDLVNARNDARAWSDASPRTPEPFRLLGVAFARAGAKNEAEAMFAAAIDLADEDPRVLLDYAEFLETECRWAELRDVLDAINPANPSQNERLAQLYLWFPSPEQAVSMGNGEAGTTPVSRQPRQAEYLM